MQDSQRLENWQIIKQVWRKEKIVWSGSQWLHSRHRIITGIIPMSQSELLNYHTWKYGCQLSSLRTVSVRSQEHDNSANVSVFYNSVTIDSATIMMHLNQPPHLPLPGQYHFVFTSSWLKVMKAKPKIVQPPVTPVASFVWLYAKEWHTLYSLSNTYFLTISLGHAPALLPDMGP